MRTPPAKQIAAQCGGAPSHAATFSACISTIAHATGAAAGARRRPGPAAGGRHRSEIAQGFLGTIQDGVVVELGEPCFLRASPEHAGGWLRAGGQAA